MCVVGWVKVSNIKQVTLNAITKKPNKETQHDNSKTRLCLSSFSM